MSDVKTMRLSGHDYAPVDERIRALHLKHPNSSIRTETRMQSDKLIEARATVIIDVANLERYFTGSAVGYYGKEKALEKLETVAVGRALAFAGFLADGRIASREEIERYNQNLEPEPAAPVAPAPARVSNALLDQLHALGVALYGTKEWSAKAVELVTKVTKGSTTYVTDLTDAQVQKLITGIQTKLDEQALSAFDAKADTQPDLPF